LQTTPERHVRLPKDSAGTVCHEYSRQNNPLIILQNRKMPKNKTGCRIYRHSFRVLVYGFGKMPSEEFKTGGAKIGLLKIRMLNPG
jgi:hypothetical protein